jgi:DNA repair protein RecO (recombination protein O)
MYINTKGLVLREAAYKETSKILTVLTPDLGKITVSAKGARRKGSKTAAATQMFAFSDMTLSSNNGRYTLTEAQCIELFTGLADELEINALGAYFCELLEAVSDEDFTNPQVLSLGLNALYALGQEKRPEKIVKAAFEMRLMCLAGFTPALDGCCVCGKHDIDHPRLDVENGTIRCRDCKSGSLVSAILCPSSLEAMRYITQCQNKRLYSFTLGDEALERLSKACQLYTETQLDRSFYTLKFYNSIKI